MKSLKQMQVEECDGGGGGWGAVRDFYMWPHLYEQLDDCKSWHMSGLKEILKL